MSVYMPNTVLRAGDTVGTRKSWFQPLWGTLIHINPIVIWMYNYKLCLSATQEKSKVRGERRMGQLCLFGEAQERSSEEGCVEPGVTDEKTLTKWRELAGSAGGGSSLHTGPWWAGSWVPSKSKEHYCGWSTFKSKGGEGGESVGPFHAEPWFRILVFILRRVEWKAKEVVWAWRWKGQICFVNITQSAGEQIGGCQEWIWN